MTKPPPERFETVIDPVDGTTWQVDAGFLESTWRCLWGAGCLGIGATPAPELGQGCCSVGAELIDQDEANRIASLGAALDPARFQYAAWAANHGFFVDAARRATAVVDGACVFLNRPGFEGGAGCALHLAATDDGDSPIDWKPAICWQLPLKVDDVDGVKRLRRWARSDWSVGEDPRVGPAELAWCCTEDRTPDADAYGGGGGAPVIENLSDELTAIVGPEVMVELHRRRAPSTGASDDEADANEAPS